jgi:hypothetical protein
MEPEATLTIYYFYDRAGQLLYIGCTGNLKQRLSHHKAVQPWWPDVVRIVTEAVPRDEASFREEELIRRHLPRYNAKGKADPKFPAPPGYARISINIPREMHAAAYHAAIDQGQTLSDWIRDAIEREMGKS